MVQDAKIRDVFPVGYSAGRGGGVMTNYGHRTGDSGVYIHPLPKRLAVGMDGADSDGYGVVTSALG